LGLNPSLTFVILAVGAVSMAAGVGDVSAMPALVIGTLRNHIRAVMLTTLLHRVEGVSMTWQGIVFGKKLIGEFINN
jgi:hypothetical protein